LAAGTDCEQLGVEISEELAQRGANKFGCHPEISLVEMIDLVDDRYYSRDADGGFAQ
jgi:hypothetical protein